MRVFRCRLFRIFLLAMIFVSGCSDDSNESKVPSDCAEACTYRPECVLPSSLDAVPELAQNQFVDFSEQIKFLTDGPEASQRCLSVELDSKKVGVLRGEVLGLEQEPVEGAWVSIPEHPEFGHTFTREDGQFDLVVNGGRYYTVRIRKKGYLTLDRPVEARKQDYAWTNAIAMTPFAERVKEVKLSSPGQIVTGDEESDGDGTRQLSAIFSTQNKASITLADGEVKELDTVNMRVTEYTVGDDLPAVMPAPLPDNVAYTYAVELSVDEASQAGATQVNFEQMIPVYVDNFLHFDAGTMVPVGYYDRDKAQWVPAEDGVVVEVLAGTDGQVQIDSTGDGRPDDAYRLEQLGVTDVELQKLATLHEPGETLWRVPVSHFSPHDFNWGFSGPSVSPNPTRTDIDDVDDPCIQSGSIIECENQVLGELLPIRGTSMALAYRSERIGNTKPVTLELAADSDDLSEVNAIHVQVEIAGKRITKTIEDPDTTRSYEFQWDGKDAYGRKVQGQRTAFVRVDYEMKSRYAVPPTNTGGSFGGAATSGPVGDTTNRSNRVLSRELEVQVGSFDARSFYSMGGWSLSAQKAYDDAEQTVYPAMAPARQGSNYNAYLSEDIFEHDTARTSALGFSVSGSSPRGMGSSADGVVFMGVQAWGQVGVQILRFTEAGNWKHVAGRLLGDDDGDAGTNCAQNGECNDGAVPGEVILTGEGQQPRLAASPDASVLYYTPGHSCVRRIDFAAQTTSTVYGECGDFEYSFDSVFDPMADGFVPARITDLAVGVDGGVYINLGNRIVRVDNNGTLHSVVGGGDEPIDEGNSSDAVSLGSNTLAVDRAGKLYFDASSGIGDQAVFSLDSANRVVKVFDVANGARPVLELKPGLDGVLYIRKYWGIYKYSGTQVELLVGGTVPSTVEDPDEVARRADYRYLPAQQALGWVYQFAVGRDDTVFATLVKPDTTDADLHKLIEAFPGVSDSEAIVAAKSGSVLDVFDKGGRLVRQKHPVDGHLLRSFEYDDNGQLVAIKDVYGQVTKIERASDGKPTAVISPHGQKTLLELNDEDLLASVTAPGGAQWNLDYHPGSALLSSMREPNGAQHTFSYNEYGKLIEDYGAEGKSSTLEKLSSRRVSLTTTEGRETFYHADFTPSSSTRQVTQPGGYTSTTHELSGERTRQVSPDGTIVESRLAPDPRYSFQAPYVESTTITLPSGATRTVTQNRQADLADADNFLDIESLTHTIEVNEQTQTAVYDAATRIWTQTSPMGRVTRTYVDDLQRPIRIEASELAPTLIDYDDLGRVKTVTRGDTSGVEARVWTYSYQDDGSTAGTLAELIGPDGRATRYEYGDDLLLAQIQSVDVPDDYIEFSWAHSADMSSLTPPGKTEHKFEYDLAHRLTGYLPPEISTSNSDTHYAFSPDGLLTTIEHPDGQQTNLEWATDSYHLNSLSTGRKTFEFSYDEDSGKLTKVERSGADGDVSVVYHFDGPLLTSLDLTGDFSASVEQTYDDFFRLSERTVNGANGVSSDYSPDGFATRVGEVNLSYNAQNGLLQQAELSGDPAAWSYNVFGEPIDYAVNADGDTQYAATYQRDRLGRITQLNETIAGASQARQFEYDARGRLMKVLQETTPGTFDTVESYQYDANGNRIGVDNSRDTLSASDITVDAQDRLTRYGDLKFSYNAAGQLTERTDTATGEVTLFDYDLGDNLEQIELADGQTIDYRIDALGRRSGRIVRDASDTITDETHWVYKDALNPIAEVDASGDVVTRFVYATRAHVPDYMTRGGQTFRIITDHLGSVRLVVDVSTGDITQQLDYDAFGNVTEDTNPGFQPFGFAGGLYDPLSGLVRFGARDYDARVGRWTAKDPIGFEGGDTDLYAYVGSDPVNYIDPSGMVIDTVLDIGFVVYDLYRIGNDNILGDCDNLDENLLALGLDVGGALIPFMTGAGPASRTVRTACFVADTPVLLCDGATQPIDEIEPGDTVWSRDPETGEFGCREVVALKVTPEQRVLSVEVSTAQGGSEIFGVTAEHPFRVVGEGWKPAEKLKPGDEIFTSAGGWMRVTGSTWQAHTQTVYNFEVADFHTYFVGDGGAWVHNTCSIRSLLRDASLPGGTHATGPFRYQAPKRLKPGDGLPTTDNGGIIDRFGNTWQRGPAHGKASADGARFEWDVQLGESGKRAWGHSAKNGASGGQYINITPDGYLSH